MIGRKMRDSLRHRGPDGVGEQFLRSVRPGREGWFGHRRLKIIDLSRAADQPMVSADGLIVLNYNGEIYNFRELRTELEAAGQVFQSSGDTEVVLRAYEQWGADFVERLDGMFALALWDGHRDRLLLARDRSGKKPLFFSEQGGRLSFASEIKSLLLAPWVQVEPDLTRVPEFLTFGYVPHPNTLYRGISQVPPASLVMYDADGVHPARAYWDAIPEDPPLEESVEVEHEIARLLEDATRRRLISDVPLGALLSGGIDSSIIVALMSRASSEPVRTFTIGFPEEPSFDERSYASLVARHFGTNHTELPVRVDAVALMETLLWHHDQPYGDSSAIPTYLVSRLAHEHVTVVLNGDGGDEIFGGYDRFVALALSELIPAPLTRVAARAARVLPSDASYNGVRRRTERFAELAGRSPYDRYQSWISVLSEELLGEVLRKSACSGADQVTRSMDDCYDRVRHLPMLDQVLYANFKTYLPDDLAVKMDRMAMANSLEARSPFLDTALIEYVVRIRARQRLGLLRLKPILRRAFRPLLPDEIWNRKKHGFGVPVARWFQSELGEMFRDEVLAGDSRVSIALDVTAVRRLWEEHQAGRANHGARLWAILTLEHWLRSTERAPMSGPPKPAAVAA